MSDVSSAGRGPEPAYPVDLPVTPAYPTGTTYPETTYADTASSTSAGGDTSKVKQVAGQAKEAAGQAATDVKDTAQAQAQRVAHEAKSQARNVVGDVRDRVGEQARTQNDKLVGTIRQTADQLDEMRGDRAEGPAAAVVSRVADGGRQLADYLDRNGPDGVLREVQDFARRRPGAFLVTALAAGFVVGRLGKSVAKADPDAGTDKPASDSFSSTGATGYTTGTTAGDEYVAPVTRPATTGTTEYAATGTGIPAVVAEDYAYGTPERRP